MSVEEALRRGQEVVDTPQRNVDDAEEDETQTLTTEIPHLREEVDKLTRTLAEVTVEESEVFKQLRSLKYALQLTRGELERRQRANSELHTAYRAPSDGLQVDLDRYAELTAAMEGAVGDRNYRSELDTPFVEIPTANPATSNFQHEEVQRLEGELLNAKRDAANVLFEVEALEFRLKRMRESVHEARAAAAEHYDAVGPSPKAAASSPKLQGRSNSRSSNVRTSPMTRAGRLIGDVDALIGFADDLGEPDGRYAPCRLGVSANGHVATYSYASPDALMSIDGLDNPIDDLCTADALALADGLEAVRVRVENRSYILCGLSEAVRAATQLIPKSSKSTINSENSPIGGAAASL